VLQLTRSGTAALAVVRLCGPRASDFVESHFDRPGAPDRCAYGRWRDAAGQVLDDVLVVEDEAGFEVNLHGGRRVVARFLEQAAGAGFRVVPAEEAIEIAADGEVEAWIPRATTEVGLRMLLAQPDAWAALAARTTDVQALLSDRTLRRLLVPATIAITGAPNVGKSTLANALFGQERSIVADIPGTTRDWVGGVAELEGVPFILIDTPGHRPTGDAIEREAIEISRGAIAAADLVIELSDASQPAQGRSGDKRALRVANKCDLAASPPGWLGISARTGQGVIDLVRAIHRRLGIDVSPHRIDRPNCWTPEQEKLLREHGSGAIPQIADRLRGWRHAF
jgi:small GTP-binding protein